MSSPTTFEKYFEYFKDFLKEILKWNPDYIVPVAKKGCKLLKTASALRSVHQSLGIIKYRQFFELNELSIIGKKIAVLDDATQHTATLSDYRSYFENLGAKVRTFSFIGHEDLQEGKRWKEDELAEIRIFLSEPSYQEYILQQAYFLLHSGKHFDLDHFVFELPLESNDFNQFLRVVKTFCNLISYEEMQKSTIVRLSLADFCNMQSVPYLNDPHISAGWIQKMKLAYSSVDKILFLSPMIFPSWNYRHSDLNGSSFTAVPFSVPFNLPQRFHKKNETTLRRAYFNIYYIAAISLLRLFLEKISSRMTIRWDNLRARGDDLEAVIDLKRARSLLNDAVAFLNSPIRRDHILMEKKGTIPKPKSKRYKFVAFKDVIDYLIDQFRKKAARRKTITGIHYYIFYDELFYMFEDRSLLSESIDYWCDLGVIVPDTIIHGGKITRGIRTGEPDADLDWKRTQVLIPLAIHQFCRENQQRENKIKPTILNKLLANFIYDYPSEEYQALHCLTGVPYMYGTLVHVSHPLRSPYPRPIYHSKEISPYYNWDLEAKVFRVTKPKRLANEIRRIFDEKQQAPYSEIVSYFRLLSRIYHHFKDVDILNMLSICREHNCFYSHILYNIRTAFADICRYMDERKEEDYDAVSQLKNAESNTKSALSKLDLAEKIKDTLEVIDKKFGSDLEFVNIIESFKHNCEDFPADFHLTFERIRKIANFELSVIELGLYFETDRWEYLHQLGSLKAFNIFKNFGIEDSLTAKKIKNDSLRIQATLVNLIAAIKTDLSTLREPEPAFLARTRSVMLKKAQNKATAYVYRNKLNQAAILYMDFSSLRDLPEPKEEIISKYYELVKRHSRTRGFILYGGEGGDDEFSIIFHHIESAICCAEEIKKEFGEDLFFFKTHSDIKFGLSITALCEQEKEEAIIKCWGLAKDCCEYKSGSYRNRGHLIIDEDSIKLLKKTADSSVTQRFVEIPNESLSEEKKLFYVSGIEPIQYK